MQEVLAQVLAYLRGIWRFRWYVLLFSWVVTLGAWTFAYKVPDQYEATARLHVDTQSLLKPLLGDMATTPSVTRRVRLMTRVLLSRPNLEEVARESDLDLQAESSQKMEALINQLEQRLKLQGSGHLNLYKISYYNKNPKLAKNVVQSLLTLFIEKGLGGSRQDTEKAQQFLKQKVQEYEARLDAAEQRLMEFKRKHTGEMPGERGDYYSRLQSKMAQLEAAQLQLNTALSQKKALERQLSGKEPTFGIMPSTSAQNNTETRLDQRIRQLQSQLDQLLIKYTKEHPKVTSLQDTIAALKERRQKQSASAEQRRGTSPSQTVTNPGSQSAYQQLQASLAEVKAEVAAARSRVQQYRQQVKELKRKVDVIPKIEARLAQLNRDYKVNKQIYQKLLERQRSAQLGEDVERSGNVKFKVIDPPRVSSEPVSPNRPFLVSGGLVGGVGAGLALGFFLAQIRPTYDSARSLHEATGLPVLGRIPEIWTRQRVTRWYFEVGLYLLGGVALLLAYGLAMAVSLYGLSLPYMDSLGALIQWADQWLNTLWSTL